MSSEKTLTPFTPAPTEEQIDKLCEKVRAAVRKSRLTSEHFQRGLGYPGTELEDEILAAVVRFSKKASGIVTPVRAEDTGLIPQGWKVRNDKPEGDVDLAKLDYSACPCRAGEEYVSYKRMMGRAKKCGAIGSLGFAAALLKAQDEGKEIFPVESRGVHYFIMPLTELRADDGYGNVACFNWDGERWELIFSWLGSSFYRSDRFVRRSE